MARRAGEVTVVGPSTPMSSHDESIKRGTVLGNPFLISSPRDRDEAIASYFTLLRGNGGTVHKIARAAGLKVDPRCSRVPLSRRLGALRRLAARVASGERIVLRCACKPRACHGDVVKEIVLRDAAAMLAHTPS